MARSWSGLFDEWAAAVIAANDEPPRSILKAPASVETIEALEARLGARLPPSYRAFLTHSDGADAFPGWGVVRWGGATEASTGLLSTSALEPLLAAGRQSGPGAKTSALSVSA